jgi:hypothetical protein
MSRTQLVAVTGGPGAGKTAILEVARKHLGHRVTVVPEASRIIFGGGFPRERDDVTRRAAQRAIFHAQRQLEDVAVARAARPFALCEGGTLDGLAYWPGTECEFWMEMGAAPDEELARYAAVVHLRSPPPGFVAGAPDNEPRSETAAEAAEIDERILHAWGRHPRRTVIPWSEDFMLHVVRAIDAIRVALSETRRG